MDFSEFEINDKPENTKSEVIKPEFKPEVALLKEPIQPELKKEPVVPFWTENPNVLLNSKYLFEYFPVEPMSFEQKLNAITRLVVLMTLITFFYTHSLRILLIGAISVFFIFMLYKSKTPTKPSPEPFASPATDVYSKYLPDTSKVFSEPTSTNPFGNVLVTDYIYNPQRKPAPPASNENIQKTIVEQAKEMVKNAHPDYPDMSEKLFQDLGDNFMFEQSLRPFHSTASTTIPNDQQSFSEFCYGSMVSCKEGNQFACAKHNARYNNY